MSQQSVEFRVFLVYSSVQLRVWSITVFCIVGCQNSLVHLITICRRHVGCKPLGVRLSTWTFHERYPSELLHYFWKNLDRDVPWFVLFKCCSKNWNMQNSQEKNFKILVWNKIWYGALSRGPISSLFKLCPWVIYGVKGSLDFTCL